MKPNPQAYKKSVERIERDLHDGKVDRAMESLEKLLATWPDHPRLLLLKAELVQLSESENVPPLSEAKKCLERAVELDANGPEPAIELGFYLLNVEDHAAEAEPYFDRAIDSCSRLLLEAIRGKAEAMGDTTARKAEEMRAKVADLMEQLQDTQAARNGHARSKG